MSVSSVSHSTQLLTLKVVLRTCKPTIGSRSEGDVGACVLSTSKMRKPWARWIYKGCAGKKWQSHNESIRYVVSLFTRFSYSCFLLTFVEFILVPWAFVKMLTYFIFTRTLQNLDEDFCHFTVTKLRFG